MSGVAQHSSVIPIHARSHILDLGLAIPRDLFRKSFSSLFSCLESDARKYCGYTNPLQWRESVRVDKDRKQHRKELPCDLCVRKRTYRQEVSKVEANSTMSTKYRTETPCKSASACLLLHTGTRALRFCPFASSLILPTLTAAPLPHARSFRPRPDLCHSKDGNINAP